MNLLKHEKILIGLTVLFLVLTVFISLTRGSVTAEVSHSQRSSVPYLIDINEATESELDTLDGIGPSLAGRIVAYRSQHGDFKRIEELCNVSGIGESTFDKIKDYIKV